MISGEHASASADDLLLARADGIVTATFNRPHARNALTFAMYDALAALCHEIDADPAVKVLVLTGAGSDAFAAGTDIAQFRTFETDADALAYETRIESVLGALERCRVPTIAAMAGVCTGGGAAIATCCDLRIGAANLRFGFPIARTLGNCLSARNLIRLKALLGEARVKEMIFTAKLIDAEDALRVGLIGELAADGVTLKTRAGDLARRVAGHAPLTLRATKQALLRQRPASVDSDEHVLLCYRSRDFREGVAAFLEKRAPKWEGR